MFGIPTKDEINSVILDAPKNFILGIEKALAIPKDKIDGLVAIGKGAWDSFTPEQQARLREAFVQLAVAGATIASKKK